MADPPALVPVPTPIDPPDLLSDLPEYEQNSQVMQATLRAIGNELGRIEAARQDLIANWFPASADALLHFYEDMLGLPVDSPTLTLAERRTTVLAFMQRLALAGTGAAWESIMTALIGNNWNYQEHDPNDPSSPPPYTILIRMPFTTPAPVPAGLALTTQATGGSLAAGTYYYAITALTGWGETLPSATRQITITAGNKVVVSWTANTDPGTSGYNIYRGSSATSLKLVATVTDKTSTSWTDAGTETPGAAPPTEDTSGSQKAETALNLARTVTPAHLALTVGYTTGFVVGVSEVGVDAL